MTQLCIRCGLPTAKAVPSPLFGQRIHSGDLTYPRDKNAKHGRHRLHQLRCPDCTQTTFAFDRCISLFNYKFPIPEIIHQYKYDKKRYWRRPLGLLLQHHGQSFMRFYYHDMAYPLPDLVIPVPIASNKLREREFNQASELAMYLAKLFSVKVHKNLVQRHHHSVAQASLKLPQRKTQMRDAYTPNKAISRIKDKNLMIVDDVVTSGNTAHHLAKLLKENGAKSVEVWALARTPKKG